MVVSESLCSLTGTCVATGSPSTCPCAVSCPPSTRVGQARQRGVWGWKPGKGGFEVPACPKRPGRLRVLRWSWVVQASAHSCSPLEGTCPLAGRSARLRSKRAHSGRERTTSRASGSPLQPSCSGSRVWCPPCAPAWPGTGRAPRCSARSSAWRGRRGRSSRSLSFLAGSSQIALREDAPQTACHGAPRSPPRPRAPIRAGAPAPSPPRPRPLRPPTPPVPRKPGAEWPSEGARTSVTPPEVLREPSLCGGLRYAMRRAAARGLSSGNALRETEGKTSRGRSAVSGLETDLKGKAGAVAAAEALRAHPSAHPSVACQDPGLCFCPGQAWMGQIAQEEQERAW